jgi:hypothetical protein
MKTTELYLEQTFIGALIMVIFSAPWLPDLPTGSQHQSWIQVVTTSSIALGLAFWLGIPFDRLADTLSERLERHNRLRFALKNPLPAGNRSGDDIFPEDEMVVTCRRESASVVSWLDYHRSRIRLARAMAVYGPALAVMLTVATVKPPVEPAYWYGAAYGVIALSYIVWAFLAQGGKEIARTSAASKYARDWGYGVKGSLGGDSRIWWHERKVIAVPFLLLVGAIVLGLYGKEFVAFGVACVAAGLTVLSAWAWWRIGCTYRSYLRDFCRFPPAKQAADRPIRHGD